MIGNTILQRVQAQIHDFSSSQLSQLVSDHGQYVIKFVHSKWAEHYESAQKLKISETPALTWGTATYVTPISFPLSSALYGRVGLVTDYDPTTWRVFDATNSAGRSAYVNWARNQPIYSDLLLTVHSTQANHILRNQFRETFNIDCVLFHPDQEAESHTDRVNHIWLAVTDWAANGTIDCGLSQRLSNARFTVLIDEDFYLQDKGLPIRSGARLIERVTERMHRHRPNPPEEVPQARTDANLPNKVVSIYQSGGYLHIFIEP